MRISRFTQVLAGLFLGIGMTIQATAQQSSLSEENAENQMVPPQVIDRVVDYVDDARPVRLAGNVHPMARPEFDMGRVDSNKLLERVVMVLKRSPEQDAALAAFNERQYDPNSPDFHHWLTAEEFGQLYGPSDADISAVTNWLQNHGMQIDEVGKGRVYIQFSGTVGNIERAFRVEMHNYRAEGKVHLANDRDPQIPAALSPVVTGLASLHDFFPTHYSHPGNYVKRDLKTGKYTVIPPDPSTSGTLQPGPVLGNGMPQPALGSSPGQIASGGAQPQLTYVDPSTGYTREELTPYDVATIYNILPLWNATTPINGKGVKVAIVALSDVAATDINTYRSSFGLPATTLTTVHSGADPGLTVSQGENTEDVEMVSATAPGAQIVLVSDVDTATTNGLTTAILYIVNNAVAPILTMSYGECELKLGTAGNTLYNQTFQQAATAGISAFVAAGDSGSAACTPQNGIAPPYSDPFGLGSERDGLEPVCDRGGRNGPAMAVCRSHQAYIDLLERHQRCARRDGQGLHAGDVVERDVLQSNSVECVYVLRQYRGAVQCSESCAPWAGADGVGRRRSEQLHGQQLHSHQHNLVPHELFRRIRETHLASGSCRNSRRRQAGLAGCFPVWLLRICLKHRDSRQCIVDLPGVRLTAEFLRLHAPGLHHLPGERWHLCRVANGGGGHGTGAAKGR